MVLITPERTIYVNEDAREYLSNFWTKAYQRNIQRLIPIMLDDLALNRISVNGLTTTARTNINRRQFLW